MTQRSAKSHYNVVTLLACLFGAGLLLGCPGPGSGSITPTPGTPTPVEMPDLIKTGDFPNGIAADSDYIYVVIGEPHAGPNSLPPAAGSMSVVQVFSALDGSLVEEIPVAAGGHSLRMTPDGSALYIAHFSLDNVVTVISTKTLEVITTVGGGLQLDIMVPDALSIAGDGSYVYVGNNGPVGAGWISRIDTTTNTIEPGWRVAVNGGYTCWVEVSPIDDIIYANSWTGGTVQRKVISSESSAGSVAVGDFPHALAIDPTGQFLYAMVSGSNSVVKLDGETLDNLGALPGPYLGLWGAPVGGVLSESGNFLFIANHFAGSVAVLDIDPTSVDYDTVVHSYDAGLDPIFMAVAPGGERLYVANNESSNITVIDLGEFL